MTGNRRKFMAMALPLCIMASPTSLFAQAKPTSGNELTIAAGAGITPSYEGSDDYTISPGALIRGKIAGMPFFSRGTNLHLDIVHNDGADGWDIGFGPFISARFNRTGHIKDSRVKALGTLDTAIEVGGWAGIAKTGAITSAYDNLSFRVSYLKDIGGAHKSYAVTPAVEYAMPLSETTLIGLSVSADYVGKGYGHYYYDIDLAGSQASGLGVYGAAGDKAGFAKLSIGLVGAQSLSGDLRKGWAIFALGGYGRLLGDYARSPIVRDAGNRDQWMGGLGVAYTF